ncbi:hypothetical protein AB0I35_22705 [Nocardia sp. NPDC050378]|uniref:hypothetical protein n=1 Tax=Nocardia sp. NPDC050378 TaxID=3155400 RepID=UPI0033CC7846
MRLRVCRLLRKLLSHRRNLAWAAGRSFIWIDDEIDDRDREWVAAKYDGRALLYSVESRIGLRHNDLAVVLDWIESVSR